MPNLAFGEAFQPNGSHRRRSMQVERPAGVVKAKHNMQLSIMLKAILVGIYPPIEIRIEAK